MGRESTGPARGTVGAMGCAVPRHPTASARVIDALHYAAAVIEGQGQMRGRRGGPVIRELLDDVEE